MMDWRDAVDFLFWILAFLAITLLSALTAAAQERNVAAAVFRITSHGASATVIKTQPGKSWLLGCAHMLEGEGLRKPYQLHGPEQPHAVRKLAATRLLAHDAQLDLSLLEHDNGPFAAVPVAPAGYQVRGPCWSIGFDEMRDRVTIGTSNILRDDGKLFWTDGPPWHGRSGGALIDQQSGYLVGVVHGYVGKPPREGLYVCHTAVLRFLARHMPAGGQRPQVIEHRHFVPAPMLPCPT